MADEDEGLSSYHSFANRYQADLELIYQKYDKTFEDGTVESSEIFLSNLEEYDDCDEENLFGSLINDDDDFDEDVSDSGWASDISGPTDNDCDDKDEFLESPSENDAVNLNKAICLEPPNSNLKSCNYPLSSTVMGDLEAFSDLKVDPKLSPVAHPVPDISSIPSCKAHDDLQGIASKYPDNVQSSNAFIPQVKNCTLSTSTQLEPSKRTPSLRHPEGNEEDIDVKQSCDKQSGSKDSTENSLTQTPNNVNATQGTPSNPSSLMKAILNTRNRIANVLVEAVLNIQKGNQSKGFGYDSLSSDSNSTASTTVGSISKESLFLPEKLLREFNTRLTAEIMGGKPPKRSVPPLSFPYPSGTSSIKKASRVIMRPSGAGNGAKRRTVALLSSRKTFKVNPSLRLPTDNSSHFVMNSSSNRKTLALPEVSTNCQQIIKAGPLAAGKVCESRDSRKPTQIVSTKAVLRFSPGLPLQGKLEVSVANGSQVQTQSLVSTLCHDLDSNKRNKCVHTNRLPLIKHSFLLSPVLKATELNPSTKRRRSIPLPTKCLPVTESERCCHSEDVLTFQTQSENQRKLPGKDLGKSPLEECLPGNGIAKVSRKRSFEDALKSSVEMTSPKRACHRPNGINQQEATSPTLKRSSDALTQNLLASKRQKVTSSNDKRFVVDKHRSGKNIPRPGEQAKRSTQKLRIDKNQCRIAMDKNDSASDKQVLETKSQGYTYKNMISNDAVQQKSEQEEKGFEEEDSGQREIGPQKSGGRGRANSLSDFPKKELCKDKEEKNKGCPCRCQLTGKDDADDADDEFRDYNNLTSTKLLVCSKERPRVSKTAHPIESHPLHDKKKENPRKSVVLINQMAGINNHNEVMERDGARRSSNAITRVDNCASEKKLRLSTMKLHEKKRVEKFEKVYGSPKERRTSENYLDTVPHRNDVGRRNSPKSICKNSQQRGFEKSCGIQGTRTHSEYDDSLESGHFSRGNCCTPKEQGKSTTRKGQHPGLFSKQSHSDGNQKVHTIRYHNCIDTRNPNEILESTRRYPPEPGTQSSKCSVTQSSKCSVTQSSKCSVTQSSKCLVTKCNKCEVTQRSVTQSNKSSSCRKLCKHEHRKDEKYVDRDSNTEISCTPGNCKKKLCLACGNFSLEKGADLSISAISRTA